MFYLYQNCFITVAIFTSAFSTSFPLATGTRNIYYGETAAATFTRSGYWFRFIHRQKLMVEIFGFRQQRKKNNSGSAFIGNLRNFYFHFPLGTRAFYFFSANWTGITPRTLLLIWRGEGGINLSEDRKYFILNGDRWVFLSFCELTL